MSPHPRLLELAFRLIHDPDPARTRVTFNCISELIKMGENPVKYDPTPLKVVIDHYGSEHQRSQELFRRLKPFLEVNVMLHEHVIFTALIAGFDLRNVTNWADIMELEDAVHGK